MSEPTDKAKLVAFGLCGCVACLTPALAGPVQRVKCRAAFFAKALQDHGDRRAKAERERVLVLADTYAAGAARRVPALPDEMKAFRCSLDEIDAQGHGT